MKLSGLSTRGFPLNYASPVAGNRSSPATFSFTRSNKACPFIVCPYVGGISSKIYRAKSLKVRASNSSDDNDNHVPIAPLELESPSGLLLSQIMHTHPHLLPAAIDEQLKILQSDRDAQKEKASPASIDRLLFRRIAEVKRKERQKSLEEIIYCLIVQKFMDNDISMIPPITTTSSDTTLLIDTWCNQEFKLENLHSRDALELIHDHLNLVLGQRVVGPLNRIVRISKLRLGKLYAASAMYGYFLKRVDERYQLEKTMKTLPTGKKVSQRSFDDLKSSTLRDLTIMLQNSSDDGSDIKDSKPYSLKSYVMYLDAETSQRYATIRAKESVSLIEKQAQALLGKLDIRIEEDRTVDAQNDEAVMMSFSGLTTLVLEAVAFGAFLWVAEGYVESKFNFISS